MSTQPTRRRLEAGVYERLGADGERLGLEIVYKDAAAKTRRRAVQGGVQDARDTLARAKVRRADRVREPDRVRVTFDDAADQWEAAHVIRQRPNTQSVYRSALKHLRRAFGTRRLTAITRADVRAYIAAREAEGLAGWTIHTHLTALSGLYAYAIEDLGLPGPSPTKGVKRSELPERATGGMRILTDEQLRGVLDCAPGDHRLYFAVLAQTGMRKSEGLGLTYADVLDGALSVTHQRDRTTGRRVALKTKNSARSVTVTATLTAALAEHRLAASASHDHDYVFGATDYRLADKAWRATRTAAGFGAVEHNEVVVVPALRLHDLRHTHVSGLIADGWDVVRVAKRIGDTIATVQDTYSHLFDEQRFADAERAQLAARYDGMATSEPQEKVAEAGGHAAETADLRAIRHRRQ